MRKNIVLLSDGTGNGAAKRNKTNVWRLYEALDLHRDDQVAFYDDGVGSQEFLPFKLLGGVFGWGLARNICQLYTFLCRNYNGGDKDDSDGDRIYLFGFSRGAFTMRMLAGMIDYCGIYKDYKTEKELQQGVKDNYNAFRSRFKNGLLTRWIRTFTGKAEALETKCSPDIEFIGVWDTVDAYGMPIDELSALWNYFIYPIRFPDYKLPENIKKACHALSVDDERKTFHPLLWNEKGDTNPDRLEQVWFPGVHSDVGGGYPKPSLSLVALDWMISRAEAVNPEAGSPGLHLIKQRRKEIEQHSDWHGPQHDSRSGVGAYYRYLPRDIEKLCNDRKKGVHISNPKIHRSVFERIAGKVIPYAPTELPEHYEIVSTRGSRPVYETEDERRKRKAAMYSVEKMIRRRRMLYFALLVTTLAYLFSPLALDCLQADQCISADGLLDPLLKMAANMLPDIAAPWINVLRHSPKILWTLILIFGVLVFLKLKAWAKTQLLATNAWAVLKNRKNNIS